jgi:hypothetical protein
MSRQSVVIATSRDRSGSSSVRTPSRVPILRWIARTPEIRAHETAHTIFEGIARPATAQLPEPRRAKQESHCACPKGEASTRPRSGGALGFHFQHHLLEARPPLPLESGQRQSSSRDGSAPPARGRTGADDADLGLRWRPRAPPTAAIMARRARPGRYFCCRAATSRPVSSILAGGLAVSWKNVKGPDQDSCAICKPPNATGALLLSSTAHLVASNAYANHRSLKVKTCVPER